MNVPTTTIAMASAASHQTLRRLRCSIAVQTIGM
jgi:hypothetical protein